MNFNDQKLAIAQTLLPWCPFIAVQGDHDDVDLPPHLRQADLVLRIGRDPEVMGMPDLELDEKGWRASLSLQGALHYVVVPWEACTRLWVGPPFAGPMVAWPEAQPAEESRPAIKQVPKPSGRPSLRVVRDTDDE